MVQCPGWNTADINHIVPILTLFPNLISFIPNQEKSPQSWHNFYIDFSVGEQGRAGQGGVIDSSLVRIVLVRLRNEEFL